MCQFSQNDKDEYLVYFWTKAVYVADPDHDLILGHQMILIALPVSAAVYIVHDKQDSFFLGLEVHQHIILLLWLQIHASGYLKSL